MLTGKSEKWRTAIFAYAPLFLWIAVIFYFSSGQGSMLETSRFIRPLLELLFPLAPDETLVLYHGYIRKAGHFTGYAILGFFAVRAFSGSLSVSLRTARYLWPLAVVATVAVLDELNQSFQASRTGSVWDILLDIFGGTVMIAALWLIKRPRLAGSADSK